MPPVKHSTSQSSTMARSDKEAEMSQKSLLKFVPFSILETQSLQTNVLHCNEARIAYRKNEHNEDGACQMAARCIHHREDCEMIWFSEYITVDLLPPTLVTSVQQPRRHCTSIYIIQYYIYIYIYITYSNQCSNKLFRALQVVWTRKPLQVANTVEVFQLFSFAGRVARKVLPLTLTQSEYLK